MAHHSAVSSLVSSLQKYSNEVEVLHGPHELDLLEAASACWVKDHKTVQARGKFGLRTRQVTVEGASFVVEAEQQLLGGALAEWQRKAEGDVGAAALDARVAERRLLHASAGVIRTAKEKPGALLALLDECLGAVAGAGAPAQLVSPSAFALLRDISQTLAHSYLQVNGGEPDMELACVLGKHGGKLQWVASIFQPKMTQAAALLPVLLDAHGPDTAVHADPALLKGCVALALQFDWTEDAGSLSRADLKTAIVPALLTLAHRTGKAAQLGRLPVNDSVSLVHSIIQVLQGMAGIGPEMAGMAYASILQILLCLSLDITATDLAGLLDMPKDAFLPLQAAQLLSVTQLVWSRTGDSQCSLLAIKVLQEVDWEAAVAEMSKPLQLRFALVLLALYKAGEDDVQPDAGKAHRRIWDLLQGPVGSAVTTFPAQTGEEHSGHGSRQAADEEGKEGAHMLCMADAPEAREEAVALWAWLRIEWALGLIEAWTITDRTEAVGQGNALVEGMQMFKQCSAILAAGQHESAVKLVLHIFNVTELLGIPYQRSKLAPLAGVLSQCLGSRSSDDASRLVQPIVRAVTKAVHKGAEPEQSSLPGAGPDKAMDRDLAQAPRKQPAAVPAPEASQAAWQWVTLLCSTAAQTRLPPAALQLLSDLVQLLYYHAQQAAPGPGPVPDQAEPRSQLQDAIDTVIDTVGRDKAQRLWGPLLAAQAEQPVKLQWLPLLACWLTSPSPPSYADLEPAAAEAHSSILSRPGQKPQHAQNGAQAAAEGGAAKGRSESRQHPRQAAPEISLDQHAEQAFQLQEAAMRVGYAAAALPLWEHFLWRFFAHQAQLEEILPRTAISRHLAELAHLYETTCPVIANLYALIAPLTPESLPQSASESGLDFISSNAEAHRALIYLHPCKLMRIEQGERALPDQAVDPAEPASHSPAAPGTTPGSPTAVTPDSAASQQKQLGRAEHCTLRQPTADPSTYQHIRQEQEELLASCATASAHIAAWSNRSGKRSAGEQPSQASISSLPDKAINNQSLAQDVSGAGIQLKSPRQSGREGDVPDSISQAQARLWEGLSAMSERLDVLHAALRELVVRRYRERDVAAVEAGRLGEADFLPADEEPGHREQWQQNREAAFAAAMEFSKGSQIEEAAKCLYLAEVVLMESAVPAKEPSSLFNRSSESCRGQLVTVLGEVVLDESMPAAGVPFCMASFQKASPVLGDIPAAQVDAVQRLMAALASRGLSASRPREALALLNHALGSERLLVEGRLQEYCTCLSAVLSACSSLQPELASSLLLCFNMAGLCAAMMQAKPAASEQALLRGSRGSTGPSEAARLLLDFSLKTSAVPGGTAAAIQLLQGIAAAGGLAAYLNACLAVVLAAESAEAKAEGMAWLTSLQLDEVSLPALTEATIQVTNALNEAESARHEVPYAFIQHLLQAPAALEALHSSLNSVSGTQDEEGRPQADGIWTAAVGDSVRQPPAATAASSSSGSAAAHGSSVLLIPVQSRNDTASCIEQLVGACLQSILRRFGSGLDGQSISEELTQLLALLMEPVGSHPWLVDWLWVLYKEALQPFLVLAGPASDGMAVMRFREMWGCLPWHHATFHSAAPEGLADLGAYLLAPDHGALDLLHALSWDSVLATLAPAVRQKAKLDARAQQWATQLALLALQCMVLLPHAQLPAWLQSLSQPLGEEPASAGPLRLAHVISAADSKALEDTLCAEVEGIPFLLQPLVDIPLLVKGNPEVELQKVAALLTSAARFSGKPEVAALASRVQQGLMFKSVGRGFIDGQAHAEPEAAHASSAAEVRECWHLRAEDHSRLVAESLLPLASLHAAAVMTVPSIRHLGEGAESDIASSISTQAAKWSAPQLSQLVNRLDTQNSSSASQTGQQAHVRNARPRPQSRLAMRSMAQPEHQGSEGAIAGKGSGASFIAAAAPAHALLSCITAHARTFLTADPMPFANAEAPLQDSAPASRPAAERSNGEAAVTQASSRLQEGQQQSIGAASKQSGVALLNKAKSVARQLQLSGRLRSDQKSRIISAEVASVRDIQIHIAGLIDDACKQGDPNLTLSLLRIGCTMPTLRGMPLGAALLESLLVSVMKTLQSAASGAGVRQTGTSDTHPGRRSSYTEQALAAAIEPSSPSGLGQEQHRQDSPASRLLQCLAGLDSEEVLQVCADASALQSPLLQAVASEKARHLVTEQEQASWRHNVSEVLRAAAHAEAQPEHPAHIAGVWLAALLWLEDGRWRKLRSGGAPTDALEALLDSLSRRTLLLSLPAQPEPASAHMAGAVPDDYAPLAPVESSAPKEGKSSSLSRFTQKVSGMVPSFRSDSSGSPKAAHAQAEQVNEEVPAKGRSKTLAKFRGKLFGSKNKQPPGTVEIPPSAFDYQSSMSMQQTHVGPLETIPSGDYTDDVSEMDHNSSPGAPEGQGQHFGVPGLSVRTSPSRTHSEEGASASASQQEHTSGARDTASKLALDVRRALKIGRKAEVAAAEAAAQAAEEQGAAEAATDLVIRLGLAAFAVSAYIKTVLCPSMSSYTPRMSSASLAADLACSGGAFANALLQRQSASVSSLHGHSQGGTPRMASTSQLGTPTASLDKLQREDMLMHELDQVLETRAELDSLEEITNCPMVAMRIEKYSQFLTAAPEMLQSTCSVAEFEARLVDLLFPEVPLLQCLAQQ